MTANQQGLIGDLCVVYMAPVTFGLFAFVQAQ